MAHDHKATVSLTGKTSAFVSIHSSIIRYGTAEKSELKPADTRNLLAENRSGIYHGKVDTYSDVQTARIEGGAKLAAKLHKT